MTHAKKPAPRVAAIPAATLIGALLLAGCSTGHIGDSWQCPLAEGGLCDSVAASDPAVPDPGAAAGTVLAEPLWRMRGGAVTGGGEADPMFAPSCDVACGAGFDPFASLARLFAAEPDEGEARPAGRSAGAASATAARLSDPGSSEAAATPVAAGNGGALRALSDAGDAEEPVSLADDGAGAGDLADDRLQPDRAVLGALGDAPRAAGLGRELRLSAVAEKELLPVVRHPR